MKRAVLFDIDGTVLDAWDFVFGSVANTVLTHKLPPLTDEQIKKAMGKPLDKFYELLFPRVDSAKLSKTHRDFQEENFHLIKPFTKTKNTLKKVKEMGFLLAAVSNRLHESVVKSLKLWKIYQYFDLVVSEDDVQNAKPDPEHLLFALKELGVKAENAFMVGDTEIDILAGKNAKVKTIGATYGWMGEKIARFKPDYLISDIGQLPRILK